MAENGRLETLAPQPLPSPSFKESLLGLKEHARTADAATLLWLSVAGFIALATFENAESVFLLVSSLPPAIVSILAVTDNNADVDCFVSLFHLFPPGLSPIPRNLLSFWAWNGLLFLADILLPPSSSLLLAKFIVVSALFWHFASKAHSVRKAAAAPRPPRGTLLNSFDGDFSTQATQHYAEYGTPVSEASTFVLRPARASASNCSVDSVSTCPESNTPDCALFACQSSPRSSTPRTAIAAWPNVPEYGEEEKKAEEKEGKEGEEEKDKYEGRDNITSVSRPSVMIRTGHLKVSPAYELQLPLYGSARPLLLENVSGRPLLFGLKTNALDCIRAFPMNGILAAGQRCEITVAVVEEERRPPMPWNGDKLAVDCTFVPEGLVSEFSRDLFCSVSLNKFRHLVRLGYVDE